MLANTDQLSQDVLSAQTRGAIEKTHKLYKAFGEANKEAIIGILKDVLDKEFTERQYKNVPWREYGVAPEMNIELLRDLGWVNCRIAESEASTEEKRKLAHNRVIITYKDGSTFVDFKGTSLSCIPNYQQITSIRDATPNDITEKKKTRFYHVTD